MMRKAPIFLILLISLIQLQAQKNYTLSGYIKDKETRDILIGAGVFVQSANRGVASNLDGYYMITLPANTYHIRISYMGYTTLVDTVDLLSNKRLDFSLEANSTMLQAVEIKDKRNDINVQSTEGSRIELPIEKLQNLPVLFGEPDILKTIQLMPGVQSGGEGSNSFYVRGGGPDQNLILLDGATIYNASHLFGFFSVFNADAISSAELIKGGMPSEFGGRTASVLNITTKEGNMERYSGEVGIGLIASRLSAEGPIVKNKASFQVSARRTYADIIMKPFLSGSMSGLGYYFYDLNAKVTYRISPNDNISFTGYYGNDVFSLAGDSPMKNNMDWGNGLASVRWNHFFSENFYSSLTGSFVDYQCNIGMSAADQYTFKLFTGVQDWNAKLGFTYKLNASNTIRWGIDYTYHHFTPSSTSAKTGDTDFNLGSPLKLNAHEAAVYILHEFEFGENWKANYGLRYSYFAQVGPFTRYMIDDVYNMNKVDSTMYGKGDLVQSYQGFEPRFNLRYQVGKTNSIKASYTRNYQYVHLAAMGSMSLPTDAWFPCTDLVQPQIADQATVGYFQNFLNNTLETSVEVYYKYMQNLIEYRDGADPAASIQVNPDYDFVFGKGQSYGIELFVNKTMGKLTGWVGYTLSWTTRNFPDIMDNKTFYAKYDRRHDISILGSYELSDRWIFSASWVFSSGNSQTLPSSIYYINGEMVTEWGDRNSWRMPNYHRLDLSATYKFLKKKHYDADLNFSIYNVYSRQNPYYIYYDVEGSVQEGHMKITPKQVSIFPILPSISLNIKFK